MIVGLSVIAGQRQAERPVLTHRGLKRILADFSASIKTHHTRTRHAIRQRQQCNIPKMPKFFSISDRRINFFV